VNGAIPKLMLAAVLLLGLVMATRVAVWPIVRVGPPSRAEAQSVSAPPAPRIAAESLGRSAIARDPFRFGRRPAAVAYDPLRSGQPPVPTPPKPVLTLVGIVWDGGKDPTALLEGLPGTDGPRAVRTGEVVTGLHVKRIDRDRVAIVGLDTTWTLTVREPWK